MGKTFDRLQERHKAFIAEQRVFFVGTAPLAGDGHVNISPKGFDTLRILDDRTVAYVDLTGSGIETVSHLKENGRFVMMFCSFGDRPLILRLHGTGNVVERHDDAFGGLMKHFPEKAYIRAIITLTIDRVADSCGWGVPRYQYAGERDQYDRFTEQISLDDARRSQTEKNLRSLDGLPGLAEPSV